MAILIEGMGMPDGDHLVLVEIDSNGDVFAAYDGGRTKLTQYKASLVPEAHGRLIDADAFARRIEEEAEKFVAMNQYDSGLRTGYRTAVKTANLAPTIIQASEEG